MSLTPGDGDTEPEVIQNRWLMLRINKSSFEVQFNFHSFEDKGNFANYDKEMIVKIF